MKEVILPRPTSYQKKVIDWLGDPYKAGKTVCIKSVRQSGKSILCTLLLLKTSFEHKGKSIYVCPNLIQCMDMYKRINSWLDGTGLIKATNGMHFSITFTNGSEILFRSVAQGNSLRGLTCQNLLVIDEAAYIADEQIAEILPFTNANNASIIVCSTPFTRIGYFFELFEMGKSGYNENIKSFDWSKEQDVELFLTPERKEFFKKTMPRQKYITEVLGEFLTNDGSVFTNITNNLISNSPNFTEVFIGIDFGTGGNDYTAVSVMNENKEQVAIYKTNNKTPMEQVEWIAGIINMFPKVGKILCEQNSIGKVFIDALKTKIKFPITNWTTTNSSKKELVNNLQIALENETVKLQNDEELVTELAAYEMNITKNGVITFNGKVGVHDDLVMATMLSLKCLTSSNGKYNIKFI